MPVEANQVTLLQMMDYAPKDTTDERVLIRILCARKDFDRIDEITHARVSEAVKSTNIFSSMEQGLVSVKNGLVKLV